MIRKFVKQPTLKGILLMMISSIFVCFGQLCWKLSGTKGYIFLILGLALYGIGALIMLYAYRFGKLSVLQPILSLNYVISTLLGVGILGENFNLQMGIGIIIIICGVIIIGGSDK